MEESTLEIPIEGKKIIGKFKTININSIEFDEHNPRISMARDSELMGTGKKEISQNMLAYFLKNQSSYLELKRAIRHSGGATIPIWIYPIAKNKYRVIEGNTRLLIHKEISEEEDSDSFQHINCMILPPGIDEEVMDYLRLICHLRGTTDWDRYEQAKYLYLLYNKEKYPLTELAKITKLNKSEIQQDIEAFKIMEDIFKEKYGEGEIVHKFSYFKEFVKNKKLRFSMDDIGFDKGDFCDWVGEKKIDRAMDVRKLNNVLIEPQSRAVFIEKDLDRALELLKDIVPEKSEKIYMLMSDLTKKIDKIEFADIDEIKRNKKSSKRKVVKDLHQKLTRLLDE